jgi:MFS transporter, OFA family, oxalate/formate antiporter
VIRKDFKSYKEALQMAEKKQKAFKTSKSNFGGRGWILIFLAGFSVLLQSSLINDSLNFTIPGFADVYGWNISLLYIFSTITSWVAVVAAGAWGAISVKKGPKFVWTLGLLIAAITAIVWSQTRILWLYFVVLMVASIAGNGFNWIGNYTICSNWFPKKKGLVMGWVTIGFPLSAMVTAPIVQQVLKDNGVMDGLSYLYFGYAGFAILLLLLVFVFTKNYPEELACYPDNDSSFDKEAMNKDHAKGLEYQKTSPWTVKKLLRTKQVWIIGLCEGVLGMMCIGIMTNFVPRATKLGYSMSEILIMLPVTGFIACFGSYLCGVFDAHVGPKKATIWTMVIAIIAIILNITPTRITFWLSLPFFGFMLGGAANYLVSITNHLWGRYDFPRAYMVAIIINNMVTALGVSIVGVIGTMVNYTAAYVVLGVLCLFALIGMTRLDDKKIGV